MATHAGPERRSPGSRLRRWAASPRSRVLVLVGLAWVLHGLRIPQADRQFPADAVLVHLEVGVWVRVAVWVAFGLVAVAAGIRRGPRAERLGFAALVIPPAVYVLSFSVSWLAWLVTGGEAGYGLAILAALGWEMAVLVVITLAGWPDPVSPARLLGTDEGDRP